MHEHWNVTQWIRALGDPEEREQAFSGCPRARELWAEDLGAWMGHALECPRCRRVVAAQALVPDEVQTCPECLASLDLVHAMVDELEHFDPLVALELPRAETMLEEIEGETLEEQITRVLEDLPLRQWGFCQRLLAVARGAWRNNPRLAHDRALLAVMVAERLNPEDYHPRWIADLQAKAHAYLANALRILGRFGGAEEELLLAEERLTQGVGSGLAEARVLSLRASLLNDQYRFREALALIAEVERLYLRLKAPVEVARNRLKRAVVLKSLERPRDAAEECDRAVAELDAVRAAERTPGEVEHLAVLALQNGVFYRLQAGEIADARALFETLPPVDHLTSRLCRDWMEGTLLREERRFGEARVVYERVRQAFAGAGLHYDAALVSLDLALAAYEEGLMGEVRRMSEEASVLLTRAAAKHEAFAALRMLLLALEREALTVAMLGTVRRRLGGLKPS